MNAPRYNNSINPVNRFVRRYRLAGITVVTRKLKKAAKTQAQNNDVVEVGTVESPELDPPNRAYPPSNLSLAKRFYTPREV